MKIRAAAHVHSDWSHDGHWPLTRIAACFRKAGYHGVLTSEHDATFNEDRWQSYRKACFENSSDDFLIVPGIEYSDRQNIVHVLVWGDIPFLGAGRETEALLQEVTKFQGVAVLAHPSRKNAWQKYQNHWAPLLLGLELWNRKVDGVAPGREARCLLKQNAGLLPFAGLDFHRANQFFPLYMALLLDGRLNEAGVLDALRGKRARAKMAGISIKHFANGLFYEAAKGTEHLRRYLRRMIKGKNKDY
jgi:hypothetical protein